MAGAQNFTELLFWQRARQWSKAIFQLTRRSPFCGDRRLVEQIFSWSEECWQRYEQITGRQRPEMFKQKSEDEDDLPNARVRRPFSPRDDHTPY